jgi:hypothetical protein
MGFVEQPPEVSLLDICSHGEFQGAAGHEAERRTSWTTPAADITLSISLWRLAQKPAFPGY